MKRDKNGRFVKSLEKRQKVISDKMDTPEGRKELAKKMVEGIRNAALVPEWGKKSLTVKRAEAKSLQRSKKRLIKKVNDESIINKKINNDRTLKMFNDIKNESHVQQNDFFKNSLYMSLKNSMMKKQHCEELNDANNKHYEKVNIIKSKQENYDEEKIKVQDKLINGIEKLKKKSYKKLKRKYGKKLASIIMYETQGSIKDAWSFPFLSNKKIKKLNKFHSSEIEMLEKEKREKEIDPPKVSPEDMSLDSDIKDYSCKKTNPEGEIGNLEAYLP